MIYLVGGAPRVGKSNLVKQVVAQHPMYAISTDAIRFLVRRSVPPEQLDPALKLWNPATEALPPTDQIMEAQNAESHALWPLVVDFMQSYVDDGHDLLVEGVTVLPELVTQLSFPYRCIILGNDSPGHAEQVTKAAQDNPYDWLHDDRSHQITQYIAFFEAMNAWVRGECKTYAVPYYNISDKMFHEDLEKAAQQLLG